MEGIEPNTSPDKVGQPWHVTSRVRDLALDFGKIAKKLWVCGILFWGGSAFMDQSPHHSVVVSQAPHSRSCTPMPKFRLWQENTCLGSPPIFVNQGHRDPDVILQNSVLKEGFRATLETGLCQEESG